MSSDWIQTLALPTVVVGVLGILIARWQLRIAKEKLRHDLYDRRFSIYMTFHELLLAIGEKDDAAFALRKANAAHAHAPFLLDSKLVAFLDHLRQEAFRIDATAKLLRDANAWSSPIERTSVAAQIGQDKMHFMGRIKELVAQFEPFLSLEDFAGRR